MGRRHFLLAFRGYLHFLAPSLFLHLQSWSWPVIFLMAPLTLTSSLSHPHLGTFMMTSGPPGEPGITSLCPGQLTSNLNSIDSLNPSLPCDIHIHKFQGLECGHVWEPFLCPPWGNRDQIGDTIVGMLTGRGMSYEEWGVEIL